MCEVVTLFRPCLREGEDLTRCVSRGRRGAKYDAVQRLNALMADGEKRSEAKAEARLRGESLFAFTDNKIHAFESRNNYQKVVMRFLTWVAEHYNLRCD
jgi:hypothetical protein